MPSSRFLSLFAVCALCTAAPARAQWLTQAIEITNGWNAVFLHVDPSHRDLDQWIGNDGGNPITQIWRWEPASTSQFVDSPSEPVETAGSGWTPWVRNGTNSVLEKLAGDTAYLVESSGAFTWPVTGKVVAPRRIWQVDGLNLVGFSTVPVDPPDFVEFLAEAPELQSANVEVYRYEGASLTNNPIRVHASMFRRTGVRRGEAFWMRSGTSRVFNRYFGPFEVKLTGINGVRFHDHLSTASFRIRNLSSNALTVTMEQVASEPVPGFPLDLEPIAGDPPLLLRGERDLQNQTFAFTNLSVGATASWTLAARDEVGSEVEVVLGLDRTVITQDPGELLAGVLRFTDSLDYTQVDVPVSGIAGSDAGLWVGDAMVTQVGQYLKSYAEGAADPIVFTNGTTVVTNDLVVTTNGNYEVTGINTNLDDVARMFPLRLIVHHPADTNDSPVLLQRVFSGLGPATNPALSRVEAALLPGRLDAARRLSATHLPWSPDNPGWNFDGPLEQGAVIRATVRTEFDDQQSNPFLHTYHPDHDNLDPRFEARQPQGSESYTLVRQIRLSVDPPGADFIGRVNGGRVLIGRYAETLRVLGLARPGGGTDTRRFEVRGVFRLDRISDIPVLTAPP